MWHNIVVYIDIDGASHIMLSVIISISICVWLRAAEPASPPPLPLPSHTTPLHSPPSSLLECEDDSSKDACDC